MRSGGNPEKLHPVNDGISDQTGSSAVQGYKFVMDVSYPRLLGEKG